MQTDEVFLAVCDAACCGLAAAWLGVGLPPAPCCLLGAICACGAAMASILLEEQGMSSLVSELFIFS